MVINAEYLTTYLQNYLSKNKVDNYKDEYIKNFPDKLYRFRKCNEDEFKSIENNYIWICPARDFEDITDSTIKYSIDSQKKEIFNIYLDWLPYMIKKSYSKTKYGNVLSDIESNKAIIEEYKHNIIGDDLFIDINKVRALLIRKGASKVKADQYIDILNKLVTSEAVQVKADEIIDTFRCTMEKLRNSYYVTCFTETYENSNLWQTYADKYFGFCIEYYFNPEVKEKAKDILFNIAPMFYGDKKAINFIDIFKLAKSEYCGEAIDKKKLDELDLTMHLHSRTKDKTYDHEKEWRLYQEKEKVNNQEYYFPYISRIILGKNIEEPNKTKIINLAKKNNFKVFQQKFNFFTSSFFYKQIFPENN